MTDRDPLEQLIGIVGMRIVAYSDDCNRGFRLNTASRRRAPQASRRRQHYLQGHAAGGADKAAFLARWDEVNTGRCSRWSRNTAALDLGRAWLQRSQARPPAEGEGFSRLRAAVVRDHLLAQITNPPAFSRRWSSFAVSPARPAQSAPARWTTGGPR
jgi:hypothetical protein